jgi:lysophospholipase L1-like esterase
MKAFADMMKAQTVKRFFQFAVAALMLPGYSLAQNCAGLPGELISDRAELRETGGKKWLETHAAIGQSLLSSASPDLAFVGDSLLARWSSDQMPPGLKGLSVLNLAVGGDQTQHMLWRLEHLPLKRTQPRTVVLLAGTNNLGHGVPPCDVLAGIEKIIDQLQQAWPQARLVVLGVLPRGKTLRSHEKSRLFVNSGLSDLAPRKGFVYVDTAAAFYCNGTNTCGYYLDDMLHLTPTGYEQMWSLLQPVLERQKTGG